MKCPNGCGQTVAELMSRNQRPYYTNLITSVSGEVVTRRNEFHNCPMRGASLPSPSALNVKNIYTLFEKAVASGLKYPKVRLLAPGTQLHLGQTTIDPRDEVVLSLASSRSKHAGTITVTDGRGYPVNTYYGRIQKDGTFDQTRCITKAVTQLVEELSKDPAGVASKYGKLTGNCCFCFKHLDDERSTEVGYGPVCARKWELPWG